MKSFKDCQVLFVAGVEGSGTTLMLKLLDRVPGYASLGGNFFSDGYEETGAHLNELTEKLWRLPRPPLQERQNIISAINHLAVEDNIDAIVYKRSYPFSSTNFVPDLGDIYHLGKKPRFILIRRHFFDNVNSILRRDFEADIDNALTRIGLGYEHLYKQINTQVKSDDELLIIDYQRLVDNALKQLELQRIADFLALPAPLLKTWSQMIKQPNQIPDFAQRTS